jgi:hypothetical protein
VARIRALPLARLRVLPRASIVSYQLILHFHGLGALGSLIFFSVVRPVMIFRFYNFGVVAVAARRQEE